jgi:hypothetical protein
VLRDSLIKLDAGKYTCLGKKYKSLVESETWSNKPFLATWKFE